MISLRRNDRTHGYLLLLLTLSLLSMLKSACKYPGGQEGPCRESLFVQIDGEVRSPGVYRVCRGTNLRELIDRAGGPSVYSLPSDLFHNVLLSSSTRVTLWRSAGGWRFSRGDIPAFYRFTLGLPISLNRESEAGLTAIPGIGPRLAGAIVRERSRRGGFKSLEEIMGVDGFGAKLFTKILPHLTL